MSRPTKYSPEIVEQARAYINGGFKELDHTHPSIVGMAVHLNIRKSTLYEWEKHEDKEFSDILSSCREAGEFELLNKGLTGDFNSNIVKLALGKHGYSDKQSTELTGAEGGPVEVDQEVTIRLVDSSGG